MTLRDFGLLWVVAVGACIGSFLNVVIWRLPRGESLTHPPSHCPKCGHAIRVWENIPVISYLCLRGRCSSCAEGISLRYPAVEFAVACLFAAVWLRLYAMGLPGSLLVYFYLAPALLAASWIDIQHRIIPDAITLPGMLLAVVLALVFPNPAWIDPATAGTVDIDPLTGLAWDGLVAMGGVAASDARAAAAVNCLLGGGIAFLLMTAVREFSRACWGYRIVRPETPAELKFTPAGMRVDQTAPVPWSELIPGGRGRILVEAEEVLHGPDRAQDAPPPRRIAISANGIWCNAARTELTAADTLCVRARQWRLPREVLGLGDVKLAILLGLCFGPEGLAVVLMVASFSGLAVGLAGMLRGRAAPGLGIPFGPFLAAGAVLWMFAGPELMRWLQRIAAGR